MAAVAARSSLIGALLSTTTPVNRSSAFEFLSGLSRDELTCIAEFQGACAIENSYGRKITSYGLLPEFFDADVFDRWRDADDRAHKTFVVLAWLEQLDARSVRLLSGPAAA